MFCFIFKSTLAFGQNTCGPGPEPPCYGCPGPGPGPGGGEGGGTRFDIPRVHAVDPNDIIGPLGFDTLQWMSVNDLFGYKIRFENDPVFATAPAQEVRINCPVDPNLNINTLTLGSYGFGDYVFTPPPNTNAYSERIDLTDSLNLVLDVTAGIDIVNKEVFWILSSIDPLTNLPPQDALTGFLPVNDTVSIYNDTIPGRGEGFVNFNIYPQKNLATGDSITAQASIVFDINEAIATNTWVNIIDAFSPTSTMTALTETSPTQSFTLSWNAMDDPGGVGEDRYDLYVSIDSAQFFLHTTDIDGTFLEFEGDPGRNYRFYIRSKDYVNNIEPQKMEADASTNTLGRNDNFPGCTDPTACNFQDFATEDDGSCDYVNSNCSDPCNEIFGCTNPQSTNYNSSATCDDETCVFPSEGCTDSTACNYNPGADTDNGTCDFGNTNCDDPCNAIVGCTNEIAENYNPDATCDDDSCVFSTLGCTDSTACNFNPFATEDDGSCGLVDCAGICAGNNVPGETCDDEDPNTIMDIYDENCNCAGTPIAVFGCTDSTACNYDPSADTDDGNCDFGNAMCSDPCNPPNPDDGCDLTIDRFDEETCTVINEPNCAENAVFNASTCSCDTDVILGCIDPCADNYDPTANEDDGSCVAYDMDCNTDCTLGDLEIWDTTECKCVVDIIVIVGCIDETACNYNPDANCEDGSCDYGNAACINPCVEPNPDDGCAFTIDSFDSVTCIVKNEPVCPDNTTYNIATCECKTDLIVGCSDNCAPNYNPEATEDDGTCETYNSTCPENICLITFTWNSATCNCIEIPIITNCDDQNECTEDSIDETTCECINNLIEGCDPDCQNESGFMQTSNTFVCDGAVIYAYVAFATVDENNVKAYVLHEEEEFDGINYIAINERGRFTSPGVAYTNRPLYISAVIGPPDENGFPKLNDACTEWTPYGAYYLFYDPIEINIVDERCEEGQYFIDVSLTGGVGGISPNWAYRSVFDGINLYTNVSVDKVITFGPYEGSGDYYITAYGAKGCPCELVGAYVCGGQNRQATISCSSSGIYNISYEDFNTTIKSAKVYNLSGLRTPSIIQIDQNNVEVQLLNQPKGIYLIQVLLFDNVTGKEYITIERLYN